MADDEALQNRIDHRVRLLINQLGADRGHKRGWIGEVAELLGVHRSDVTKIRAGQRRAGMEVAERAAHRLGITMSYFRGDAEPSDWRDYEAKAMTNPPLGQAPPLPRIVRRAQALQDVRYEGKQLDKGEVSDLVHMAVQYGGRLGGMAERVRERMLAEFKAREGEIDADPVEIREEASENLKNLLEELAPRPVTLGELVADKVEEERARLQQSRSDTSPQRALSRSYDGSDSDD